MKTTTGVLGALAAVMLSGILSATQAADMKQHAGTLRLADGKTVEFSNIKGVCMNFRVQGGWEAVSDNLVLVQKEEERIPFAKIQRIDFDKSGKTHIHLHGGKKKTTEAIIMVKVTKKDTGTEVQYGGTPLHGATISLTSNKTQ